MREEKREMEKKGGKGKEESKRAPPCVGMVLRNG